MAAFGVTLQEVLDAASGAKRNTPGGYLQSPNQEALIRNIGRTASLEEIEKSVVVIRGGVPVLLKDVAEVQFGRQIMRGDEGVNGSSAVVLSIQKQPGSDTVSLTSQVEKTLKEISRELPKDVKVTSLFKQANFISSAISNVEEALRDGAIIVAIILILFLLNARTTFITLTAIPLSIIISAIVFKLLGLSINTMTLGGLAIAIG